MQLPTGASRVIFILAHPAGHVRAPHYYTPYFREHGLDWHMVPLDIAPKRLTETIRTLATSASVGAGGAGRAICHVLAAAGLKRLRILNEVSGPVEALAAKLRSKFPDLDIRLDEDFGDAGLLVNATPLGLHATDAMPVDPAKLPNDCAVFDIIAGRRTEFMNAAAARGLKVVDGVAMIRHQLPIQTAFWKGET
jgi:shikimate 5-dehydrogenase